MPIATQLEMLGEVALATALGALIGLEREVAHKAAGLRTHMLVAGAAAMLVGRVDALLHGFLLPAISPLVRDSARGESISARSRRLLGQAPCRPRNS